MENFMKYCRVKISLKYFNETFRENFINFIRNPRNEDIK